MPPVDQDENDPIVSYALLDGGSSFTVAGPKGSVTLPSNPGKLSEFNTTGSFLVPGPYTVTGKGGANVGPFSGTVTIPASPT